MTLIKSISGIRGTIGGSQGDNLTPIDIVKFTTAYARFMSEKHGGKRLTIVVGRDARISGGMVNDIIEGTLLGCGVDVINVGLCTTPGTEMAVITYKADGGIIITASHNPKQWNALKLLNRHGEFLTAADGGEVLKIAEEEAFVYADVEHLGKYTEENFDNRHVESILNLKLVDADKIHEKRFTVCVDAINSVGSIILPKLLDRLGVGYTILNKEPNGDFEHNPEPLEKNLQGIMNEMKTGRYNLGIVVDPDVDRLAFITEEGKMFGEEYTLVAVADYILSEMSETENHPPLNTVSNLSSTRALRDVTEKYGGTYTAAAVGEVNVTTKMKETGAVIGGEGNGGVIYPDSHYGRDALAGIGLFLSLLAKKDCKVSELRATYPEYHIAKNRIDLTPETDVDAILAQVKEKYSAMDNVQVNDIDGVKIDFADKWVHLRKSNTEPIIRIYSEAHTMDEADALGKSIMDIVYSMA